MSLPRLLSMVVCCALAAACGGNKCGTPIKPCSGADAESGKGGNAAGAADGGGSGGASAGAGGAGAGAGGAGTGGSGGASSAGALQLIGVGDFGLRARSDDGADWSYCSNAEQSDDHTPDLLRAVAYGDGVFIAVGGNQNGRVMRSLDGEHWEEDVHPLDACPDET